jgi:hypothetical protein
LIVATRGMSELAGAYGVGRGGYHEPSYTNNLFFVIFAVRWAQDVSVSLLECPECKSPLFRASLGQMTSLSQEYIG